MSIDPYAQTQWIKQQALDLGFDAVGVFSPPTPLPASETLIDWLAQGYHGEMAWMAAHLEKRLHPAALMPDTQAIVCVTMNYYFPDVPNPAPEPVKIAKYARGTDYHDVVKKRLKTLLTKIQEQWPDVEGRAVCDSAPVWEKVLAQQAGLGWIGKNGMLIDPRRGSFFFLGELLLNIPLAGDAPVEYDYCGRCRRCMEACPTDAIVSPKTVDANRCIAYWTIEYKGETLPSELAAQMDGWVFGCDICQDMCPWNARFALPTTEADLLPRPWNQTPDIESLLALTPDAFAEHYRKSPVKRAKYAGFRRNVLAWKNHGKPKQFREWKDPKNPTEE